MTSPRPVARLAFRLALLACAGAAHAQNTPAQNSQDQSPPDRLEEARRLMPRVPEGERPVRPTLAKGVEPVAPGLTRGEGWGEPTGLAPAGLPEGSFLIERPGNIIPGPNGRKIFVPAKEGRVAGEGPMLILPNAALERLEIPMGKSQDAPFRVSGEVFVYHGRRHLLLSSFLIGAGEAQTDDQTDNAQGEKPAAPSPNAADAADPDKTISEPAPESTLDDPDVRALLEELRDEAGDTPHAEQTEAARVNAPVQAGTTGVPPAPDGTPVLRRRGRLVRLNDGAWAFVFDNDDTDALAAQAMPVMPCMLLERVERDAMRRGDAAQIVVSGRVYTHDGVAYLLPTMITRPAPTGVVPMQ